MRVLQIDHVQLAMPPGTVAGYERVFSHDPFGNRIEFMQAVDSAGG